MLTPNLDIARKRTKNKILIRNDLYKVTNAQKEIGKIKNILLKLMVVR